MYAFVTPLGKITINHWRRKREEGGGGGGGGGKVGMCPPLF